MAGNKKLFFVGVVFIFSSFKLSAQYESIVQEGEIGITGGAAHYFGDLNPDVHLNHPTISFGAFFRKQFGNYVAIRVAAHYAQLGYSDVYNTQNAFDLRRNLSFNTNIFEGTVQGDFNFFKFSPGDPHYRFTPYITFGLGVFSYNPYTYFDGQKVFLRALGTEGQGSAAYPNRKAYGTMAFCFPLGVGVKYSLNPQMNLGPEVSYRFTTTDYIDDVSTTYAGISNFPTLPDGQPSLAALLQDRSYESGTPIGIAGRQRGYSNQNDTYVFAELTLSINIRSYKCPTAD